MPTADENVAPRAGHMVRTGQPGIINRLIAEHVNGKAPLRASSGLGGEKGRP